MSRLALGIHTTENRKHCPFIPTFECDSVHSGPRRFSSPPPRLHFIGRFQSLLLSSSTRAACSIPPFQRWLPRTRTSSNGPSRVSGKPLSTFSSRKTATLTSLLRRPFRMLTRLCFSPTRAWFRCAGISDLDGGTALLTPDDFVSRLVQTHLPRCRRPKLGFRKVKEGCKHPEMHSRW